MDRFRILSRQKKYQSSYTSFIHIPSVCMYMTKMCIFLTGLLENRDEENMEEDKSAPCNMDQIPLVKIPSY